MRKERVVITGVGAIACNGNTTEEFIENVNNSVGGLNACTRYDLSNMRSNCVGEIDYDTLYQIYPNEDDIEKTVYLAYCATLEAMKDSKINFEETDKKVAIVIGTLFGGYNTSTYVHENFLDDHKLKCIDTGKLDYFSACSIPNYLAKKFKIKSMKMVVSNACASGGSAVGIAFDLIQSNLADIAIVGGADELNRLSLAGFNSLGALATENCTPYTNSRGINIGEGASILILEKLSDAKKRGCKPKAEIVGYELNSDAFHVTAPNPNGEGAYRAMKEVLKRNHIMVNEVSYINGHGTGTNANDSSEIKSVKKLFADSHMVGKIISNKGFIGHCMGAAGALELCISVKSIENQIIPPTYHENIQKEIMGVDIVKEAEKNPCSFIISNSFAFGGNNVSIGISSPEYFSEKQLDCVNIDDDIVITGVGCIGNKFTTYEEYLSLLQKGDTEFYLNKTYEGKYSSIFHGVVPEYDYRKYMSPDIFRKTDFISKISMVSASAAIKSANIAVTRENCERIGLVYGTGTGPITTIEKLNHYIIQKGLSGMNAFSFPNSVNNAAPGYITMNSRIKGTTITINSGGCTFLSSLLYAKLILLQNKADQIIVTVSDDYNEIYHAAHDKLEILHTKNKVDDFFTRKNTLLLSPGSVSIILERKQTALSRKVKIYAKLLNGTMSGDCNSVNGLNLKSRVMTDTFLDTIKSNNILAKDLDVYFSGSTGIAHLDLIEKLKVISKLEGSVVSSARQFCGYNTAIIPAYSVLSAIAAFEGYPLYDVVNNKKIEKINVKNAMISSYALGETYSNLILEKYNDEIDKENIL